MNFALVIQGKMHQHSLDAIKYYSTLGDVYLSHYDDLVPPDLPIKEVVRSNPEIPVHAWNGQNVYLQCLTTLAGINAAIRHGGYDAVIKLRSDQSFGNLDPFLYAVKSDPNKYTCSNLHFRPDRICKFHASDKLIGGDIYKMRDCFTLALRRCVTMYTYLMSGIYEVPPVHNTSPPYMYQHAPDPAASVKFTFDSSYESPFEQVDNDPPVLGYPRKLAHNYDGIYPEVLIATSWLMAGGIIPNRYFSKHQMANNFRIVRVEELGPYIGKHGSNVPEHNWVEIDHISQL